MNKHLDNVCIMQKYNDSEKVLELREKFRESEKYIIKAVNLHNELVNAINNIEKLSIGFNTSLFNVKQRNAIALIYQNCMNIKQALAKAGE